ncbi:hypothetical protein DUI87_35032 [Hirundo rustica rustica]|uniref:Uncharacterized protein n=1 Tax=Hirundo rustica rustica TaxID=333673 RepID=A0A3M0IGG1_HIRRU|nr:hypothetical protein DUI87_35032 [Hirundo rustica rustica]
MELGSEPGISLGIELRGKAGIKLGSEPGSEPGSQPGSELGSKAGVELGIEPRTPLGSELGDKAGIELGSELRIPLGSEPGISLGSELGGKAGIELGSEPGIPLGSEPGIPLGSDPGSPTPGAVAGARSSPAQSDPPSPSSGRSPGIGDARTEGDGCAQGTERDPAGAGRSRESSAGTIRTLSVTSNLGLLLAASEAGSDTSYCFSSVAKIQVEENFIPERRDKDRPGSPRPGLRGKVYDYFVQSVSESVSRWTSLPFVPAGTSLRQAERRSGTRAENPAWEIPDPNTSAAPQESSPEPPPPGRNGGTLGIAPQLPPPGGLPAADPEPSAAPAPARCTWGTAARFCAGPRRGGCGRRRRAALRLMSRHLLQVLRSPHVYGLLNAAERELLPALRKPRPAAPGGGRHPSGRARPPPRAPLLLRRGRGPLAPAVPAAGRGVRARLLRLLHVQLPVPGARLGGRGPGAQPLAPRALLRPAL